MYWALSPIGDRSGRIRVLIRVNWKRFVVDRICCSELVSGDGVERSDFEELEGG